MYALFILFAVLVAFFALFIGFVFADTSFALLLMGAAGIASVVARMAQASNYHNKLMAHLREGATPVKPTTKRPTGTESGRQAAG